MDNRELFEEGPKLAKCDGCGRYFEEQMLKQCRACGKSFCPECRITHDCRETPRTAPQAVIRGFDDSGSAGYSNGAAPSEGAVPPRRRVEMTFIDTDGSSIGGASLRGEPAFGSYQRYDSEGKRISFNDYGDAGIGSADLKRYDDTKVYGDDRYSAPVPAPQAVYSPQPQYVPPMPPYTPERAAPAAADYSRSPQQGRAAAGQTNAPPIFVYVAPTAPAAAPAASKVIDTIPELAEDELRCDDCGKIWKKSELRRCKKCGAVLCPECRENHICGKKQKANVRNAGKAQVRVEQERNTRPRKRQDGKKANKKMIMMLIVLLIFLVAIAIAAIMLIQNGSLTPPTLP